jgi:hypothetical protein
MPSFVDMADKRTVDNDVLLSMMPVTNIPDGISLNGCDNTPVKMCNGYEMVRQNDDKFCEIHDDREGKNDTAVSQLGQTVAVSCSGTLPDNESNLDCHNVNSMLCSSSSPSLTCSYEKKCDSNQANLSVFSMQIQSDAHADEQLATIPPKNLLSPLSYSACTTHAICINSSENTMAGTAPSELISANCDQKGLDKSVQQKAADCGALCLSPEENNFADRRPLAFKQSLPAVVQASDGSANFGETDMTCLDAGVTYRALVRGGSRSGNFQLPTAGGNTGSASTVSDDHTDIQKILPLTGYDTADKVPGKSEKIQSIRYDFSCKTQAASLSNQFSMDDPVINMHGCECNPLPLPMHSPDKCQSGQFLLNLTVSNNAVTSDNANKEDFKSYADCESNPAVKSVDGHQLDMKTEDMDFKYAVKGDAHEELTGLSSSSVVSEIGVCTSSSCTSLHYTVDEEAKRNDVAVEMPSFCSFSSHVISEAAASKSAYLEKTMKVSSILPETNLQNNSSSSTVTEILEDSAEMTDIGYPQLETTDVLEDSGGFHGCKKSSFLCSSSKLTEGDFASTGNNVCEFQTEQSHLWQEKSLAVETENLLQHNYECDDSSDSDGDGDWEEVEGLMLFLNFLP